MYLLDKNPAGFFSLKKTTSGEIYHTVLPLGMDEIKATSDAKRYIEENDPGAQLMLSNDEVSKLLDITIPFKAHKGESIGRVLAVAPDYLQWVLSEYNEDHKVIGPVVKALKTLIYSHGFKITPKLKPEFKETLESGGANPFIDIAEGQPLQFKFSIKSILPFKATNSAKKEVFRIELLGEKGARYYTFGYHSLAKQLTAGKAISPDARLACTAIAKKKSSYKGNWELQVQSVKLLPTSYFGVAVKFSFSKMASKEFILEQLKKYSVLNSPIILGVELISFEESTQAEGSSLGFQNLTTATAIFKVLSTTILSGSELVTLIKSSLVEQFDGLLGLKGSVCSLPID